MTDIRRSNEARIHQTNPNPNPMSNPSLVAHAATLRGDSFRGSCNSTPEPRSTYPNGQPPSTAHLMANGHHHHGQPTASSFRKPPPLQALADHVNVGSTTSGSTSSSTATTARCNGGGGGDSGVGGLVQFDDRDVYHVSPSKRKGNVCGGPTRCADRLKASATIAPSFPAITPAAAYGARIAGGAGDSFETSSHYSDTAMQLLRSGSCAGGHLLTSSNSSLVAPTSARPQSNVVTFSAHVGEEQRATMATPTLPQNRGSLRRHKGRSNQSLCSCDAGADTEINPDPTRPLYQYSLERRHKGHTYTCEQNAQILMRLERERNRKLSLGGGGGGGSSKDDTQSDTQSSSDMEPIPPVPPPPSMKRQGSMRSLRQQQQQQQPIHPLPRPSSTCSSSNTTITNSHNNNITGIATLCSGDLLNDCANSALEVGSLIDDCTTSILKCANAVGSELMAATSSGPGGGANGHHYKGAGATSKPDVCRVATPFGSSSSNYPAHCIRDDIFLPSAKNSDPSLCFLHVGGADGEDGRGRRSHWSLGKYNTIGPSSDYARQLASYRLDRLHHQQQQQQQQSQHQNPRQLSASRISERCRCLSQSLSNFSRDYFGQTGHKGPSRDLLAPPHHIYYTGGGVGDVGDVGVDDLDWLKEPPPPPPAQPLLSRSYGNLVDIATYHKFHTPATGFSGGGSGGIGIGSSIGNANASNNKSGSLINNSFAGLTTGSSSGLKEKLQQHQHHHEHHHQLHQLQPHTHTHSHSHAHQQQQQHHVHQQQHQQQQQQTAKQQQQLQLHSSVTSIMPWKHRQCPSRGSSSSGTNSFRFDAAKHWLAVSSILLIIGAASVAVPLALRVAASAPFEERLRVAVQLLDQVPLIDGHNDLPWNIRKFLHNKLNDFNFDEDLRNVMPWARSHWSHTDLQRLKKGRISAQVRQEFARLEWRLHAAPPAAAEFELHVIPGTTNNNNTHTPAASPRSDASDFLKFWAAYVPCEAQHRDAVQLTLEQIDVIKRLTDRYAPQLTTCTSAEDIIEAHKNHQLCSLTGVEGGHSLGGSLAVLRTLYAIGVRYMTLTSTCHTPWADSSYADAPTFNVKHGGLTIFGKTIIREMNRLGMMVDLSHVSTGTMRDALEVSEAPVIFSHSSAYELCNSSRNVQDDMLQSLAKNGGLVMVNFYSKFLSCSENSTVHDAVAHINHIKRIAGIDHVGLGAGFDGINFTPKGLEDVSSYPTLFAELLGVGWSIEDLTKLAGGNFLRVMQQVEKIRDEKKAAGVKPYEDHPNFRTDDPYNCTSS